MKCRDDWHVQPRKQRHDVIAGLAAEDPEFMLQANDVELPLVEEIGGAHVILQFFIIDLQANDGRIVVGVAVVGHRHDGGVHVHV